MTDTELPGNSSSLGYWSFVLEPGLKIWAWHQYEKEKLLLRAESLDTVLYYLQLTQQQKIVDF